jgi:hypothetical protein
MAASFAPRVTAVNKPESLLVKAEEAPYVGTNSRTSREDDHDKKPDLMEDRK